jgi:hypothetical protein
VTPSTSSRSWASTATQRAARVAVAVQQAERACGPQPAPSATSAAAAHPEQVGRARQQADREREVGVRRREPLAGVRPGEHGPQVVGDVPAGAAVEQREQHPRPQLAWAEQHERLPQRGQLLGAARRGRVRGAQHAQREAGVAADEVLDPRERQVGVGELAEQPGTDELRRRQHPALEEHRALQVPALEQVEAEFEAVREGRRVLDPARHQRHTARPAGSDETGHDQRRQRRHRQGHEVGDLGEGGTGGVARVVGQRDPVAVTAQPGDAGEQLGVPEGVRPEVDDQRGGLRRHRHDAGDERPRQPCEQRLAVGEHVHPERPEGGRDRLRRGRRLVDVPGGLLRTLVRHGFGPGGHAERRAIRDELSPGVVHALPPDPHPPDEVTREIRVDRPRRARLRAHGRQRTTTETAASP